MADGIRIDTLTLEVSYNAEQAVLNIERLIDSLKKLKQAATGGAGLKSVVNQLKKISEIFGGTYQAAEKAASGVENIGRKAEKAASQLYKFTALLNESRMQMEAAGFSGEIHDSPTGTAGGKFLPGGFDISDVAGFEVIADDVADGFEGINRATQGIDVNDVTNGFINLDKELRRKPKDIKQTNRGLYALKDSLKEVQKQTPMTTQAVATSMKEVSKHTKSSSGWLGTFAKRLKGILIYRAIRSILSGIASAMKEGIGNLYQYSKAINSVDSAAAANTLDAYASTLLQVKNSVAAAAAPLLQALLPVIKTVAGWFITAANAVNQFISALQGKDTYTRAKEYAVEYTDAITNGANGATSAVQELQRTILGFDELNVLNGPTGGGGGGGGGGGSGNSLSFGDMFEEANIGAGFKDSPILELVKGIIQDVKEIAGSPLVKEIMQFIWDITEVGTIIALTQIKDVLDVMRDIAVGDWDRLVKDLWKLFVDITDPLKVLDKLFNITFSDTMRNNIEDLTQTEKGVRGVLKSLKLLSDEWANNGKSMDVYKEQLRVTKEAQNQYKDALDKFNDIQGQVREQREAINEALANGDELLASALQDELVGLMTLRDEAVNNLRDAGDAFEQARLQAKKFRDELGLISSKTITIKVNFKPMKGTIQMTPSNTYGGGNTVGPTIYSIAMYGQGGWPTNGELFVSRENGPEMVGRIGTRNAVANNDQIVAGIENGVYRAVTNAMQGQNSNVTVNVDGQNLFNILVNRNNSAVRTTGRSPLLT